MFSHECGAVVRAASSGRTVVHWYLPGHIHFLGLSGSRRCKKWANREENISLKKRDNQPFIAVHRADGLHMQTCNLPKKIPPPLFSMQLLHAATLYFIADENIEKLHSREVFRVLSSFTFLFSLIQTVFLSESSKMSVFSFGNRLLSGLTR